ncbi:pathogenesis-related protein 1 [Marchantia polymorpha subsp. ruderalis]|uniref:SCP domain-containing protein n=2 Tax=Marchantia polymorpha TaxID=3197 RepID=A0A176VPQ6_MARPO|nr:hypothetical protein AXG93_4139s1120 [Marchantia polymorpha subsp. ruderalis]PTQ33393.1 hypothetical protein MARPO_0089s0027 [Marchantia polymorpha]BBN06525.1 hypothetical protein Mp_3g21890 [Marchantia polymorpha subsp. ruderalis]|eukprot:PTQ33393.1 hypothetical protein MARPO_0089s0027 [Marchantia polymorpha]
MASRKRMSLVLDVVTCCVLVIGFISRAAATHIEGEYLERHNEARSRVGISDLEWSNSLESYATDYAERQASYGCSMVHSNGPYGENLYWSSGYSSPSDAVESWLEEGRDYNSNFNSCSFGRVCGHYTQIIWRNTRYVGCGSATCPTGGKFVVCSYYPPGNYYGENP